MRLRPEGDQRFGHGFAGLGAAGFQRVLGNGRTSENGGFKHTANNAPQAEVAPASVFRLQGTTGDLDGGWIKAELAGDGGESDAMPMGECPCEVASADDLPSLAATEDVASWNASHAADPIYSATDGKRLLSPNMVHPCLDRWCHVAGDF